MSAHDAGLTGYNPVRRAYLYCPLEYWGPFLQSNEGRDAMHRLRDYINYDITVLNKPTTPVDVRVRAPDPGSDRWAAKRDTGGGQHQLPHHPMAGAPHWADGEYKFFQLRGKSWRTPPPNTVGIDMILRRDAINANVWQDMDM